MINPAIVQRSPESEMKVWTETCLVLPPTFRATVLRDARIDVEYYDVNGVWHSERLRGELARAAQHELDHDRGILTLDHIDLDEMENDVMRSIERPGHDVRQQLAFARAVDSSFYAVAH
jgi:peptide deformylase